MELGQQHPTSLQRSQPSAKGWSRGNPQRLCVLRSDVCTCSHQRSLVRPSSKPRVHLWGGNRARCRGLSPAESSPSCLHDFHRKLPSAAARPPQLVTAQLALGRCPSTELHSAPNDGKGSSRSDRLQLPHKAHRVLKSYQKHLGSGCLH